MVAFEISINGNHIYTIAVGEFGLLNADVMWARIKSDAGPIHEELRVTPRGMDAERKDALHWQHAGLKVGDAVTVRIVESSGHYDQPSERITQEERNARNDHRKAIDNRG